MTSIVFSDDNADAETADVRRRDLDRWVAAQLGLPEVRGVSASSDASFRRYFRYPRGAGSVIAMDAPPPQEDCRPFVAVAQLFGRAGAHVPSVLAQDLDRGYLLLSDLGTQTYLDGLTDANADRLFGDAIEALLRIQMASEEQFRHSEPLLPLYDEALLRRELALFPQWYLERHLGLVVDSCLADALNELFDRLVERALGQGRVFVHRDYMPRNLMLVEPGSAYAGMDVTAPDTPARVNTFFHANDHDRGPERARSRETGVFHANPGVIDFQDAVYGPISYDPTCLFKDAFVSWPAGRVEAYLHRYWRRAAALGLPVPQDFKTFQIDCDWMGVQRHLKVLGIFARIRYRDGKPHYLEDAPRFVRYLREVADRYPELPALRDMLPLLERGNVS